VNWTGCDVLASDESDIARINDWHWQTAALLVCPLPHKMAAERQRACGKEALKKYSFI
jgi:hypothetical protein|tara:strand:- start:188 stop:361 length:174 start_codon:yes stop_codon:yes gene_type:complete